MKNSGSITNIGYQNLNAFSSSSGSNQSGSVTPSEVSDNLNIWFKPTFDGKHHILYHPSEWLRDQGFGSTITIYQYVGGTFWYNSEPGEGETYMNGTELDNFVWTYSSSDPYFTTYFDCLNGNYYDYIIKQDIDGQTWHTYWTNIQYPRTLSAPTNIAYSGNTVTFDSVASLKVIEFTRVDGANPYGYSTDTTDLFFDTSCSGGEESYYYYGINKRIQRFPTGVHTIGVIHNTSTPSAKRTEIYQLINDWLYVFNGLIAPSGVSFTLHEGSSGDITVYTGNHLELWGWTPTGTEWQYGGSWSNFGVDGWLVGGEVRIRWEDTFFTDTDSVTYEEMTEVMGCGTDSWKYQDTIFSQFAYQRKNAYFDTRDSDVVRFLYNENLPINSWNYEIAKLINAPSGHISTSGNSINLSFLQPNTDYKIRMWSVNEGDWYTCQFSPKTDWIYITTPDVPLPWSWTHINTTTGDIYNGTPDVNRVIYLTTATEWQAWLDKINEVREFLSYSTYSFTPVSSGTVMNNLFSEPISAINEMLDAGNQISFNGLLNKNYFIQIRDKLNGLLL